MITNECFSHRGYRDSDSSTQNIVCFPIICYNLEKFKFTVHTSFHQWKKMNTENILKWKKISGGFEVGEKSS